VIERSLVDLLRLMSSRRLHEARTDAVGLRLSRTQLHFLSWLDERGPCGVSRLAESAGVSQPAASRAVGQLEIDGYVSRSDDCSDRRMTSLAITPAGRRVRHRLREVMRGQLSEALAPMSERRRAELGELMAELVERLKGPGARQP